MTKGALVVQRHDLYLEFIQELLSELDYESVLTNNLRDAIRYLEQRRFDAFISGSMYKIDADGEVDDNAWKALYDKVSRHYPQSTFILFTLMGDIDVSGYENPTVHRISKFDLNNLKENFRSVLR